MKITKILSYTVYPHGIDEYLNVCRLLNQEIDPPSNSMQKIECNESIIYASPLKRSRECIGCGNSEIHHIDALKEIPFEFKNLCTRENFNKDRNTSVRKAFVEGFVLDKLLLSRHKLQLDILEIERLATTNLNSMRFVSHTFRMKILQLYYQTNRMIFEKPEILRDILPANKHLFDFGETIEIPIIKTIF